MLHEMGLCWQDSIGAHKYGEKRHLTSCKNDNHHQRTTLTHCAKVSSLIKLFTTDSMGSNSTTNMKFSPIPGFQAHMKFKGTN